jgi:hypothetical protein
LLDLLLDAQRRLADADIEYYRSLTNYNLSIANVHLRKNSLLDYNAINLAEGPWPCKAYFDANRLARQRDAGTYMNYGRTSPRVFSRGPTLQHADGEGTLDEMPTPAVEEIEPAPAETNEMLPPPPVTRAGLPNRSGATAGLPSSAFGRAATRPAARGGWSNQHPLTGNKFDWGDIGSGDEPQANSANAAADWAPASR